MIESKKMTRMELKYSTPECRTVVFGTSCVLCGSLNDGGLQDMTVTEFDWENETTVF